MSKYRLRLAALVLAGTILGGSSAFGAKVADIRATVHNLSSATQGSPTPTGTVPLRDIKAASEDQVCVFCHTPHGASTEVTPLWNHKLSTQTYNIYSSDSLDAEERFGGTGAVLDQPGGSSKLCLSCHDGTIAIGAVNVLSGVKDQTIAMNTGATATIPAGKGAATGYTRNLGIDLSNDHPISVDYTNLLAQRDGELRVVDANQKWPNGSGEIIGVRSSGYKPLAPLELPVTGGTTGQIQCATCHDPHLRETSASAPNEKFLRLNRFQQGAPSMSGSFNPINDINCVACHDKGYSYPYSVHANPLVATQWYTGVAATERDFADPPSRMFMWKASCLNCHDTHSVQGSRLLLREGSDSTASPKGLGNPAGEETCYQCHSNGSPVVTPMDISVARIKEDYALRIHMPITSAEQNNPTEVHQIGGKKPSITGEVDCTNPTNKCGADFIESRDKLGFGIGNLINRHAECSDCHNPHRMVKFQTFSNSGGGGLPAAPHIRGTHVHAETVGAPAHTNIISGVLRGTTGVEPQYTSASFNSLPTGYLVKRGDPGTSSDLNAVTASYVTREYQICLNCHSDYGYTDTNGFPTGSRPDLGISGGGTPSGTNGMTQYTNQAKEFQAPVLHQGAPLAKGVDGGAALAFDANNHRSWHPVMDVTGRTPAMRSGALSTFNATQAFYPPWDGGVGSQTMYCSDCHGSDTAPSTSSPKAGNPWGPHGSTNNFLLKGNWDKDTGYMPDGVTSLCYKCHKTDTYLYPAPTVAAGPAVVSNSPYGSSGFSGTISNNLHAFHNMRIGVGTSWVKITKCSWCHVAVPHGWKNKGLLVNLNDVGAEAGLPSGTAQLPPYNQEPYYMNSYLGITTFKPSGQWEADDCGGLAWMQTNCANPQ